MLDVCGLARNAVGLSVAGFLVILAATGAEAGGATVIIFGVDWAGGGTLAVYFVIIGCEAGGGAWLDAEDAMGGVEL